MDIRIKRERNHYTVYVVYKKTKLNTRKSIHQGII